MDKKDTNNCFVLEESWHRAAAALPGWISVKKLVLMTWDCSAEEPESPMMSWRA